MHWYPSSNDAVCFSHTKQPQAVACLPGCAVGLEFETGPVLHTSLPAAVVQHHAWYTVLPTLPMSLLLAFDVATIAVVLATPVVQGHEICRMSTISHAMTNQSCIYVGFCQPVQCVICFNDQCSCKPSHKLQATPPMPCKLVRLELLQTAV